MKPFNRRNFLKIAGIAAAGAAGSALGQKKGPLPAVGEGDPWPDREERWVASVCQLCPGGCGVRARVVDGRVVKVDGNPLHPVNRGRLCPVGQAAPQLLYHPDRLRSPMAREGDGKLRPVSWEEGVARLARALKQLRERDEAHTAVFLAGPYHGLRDRFLRRFMAAFGSPNYIRACETVPESPDPAHVLTQGVEHPLAPDLFHANSILSFGLPLLEGGPSPVYQMRAYGHFRQGEGRPRGVLIQVEPRRSATAERADKWVAIRPGTETALALGIAHVLILEHLYDEAFVERYCAGFNDSVGPGDRVVPGFRTIVLREFSLPRVSRITGVPVETILGVARAFARNQPGVAIGPPETPNGPARLGLRLAVHFLNALVGNLGRAGGMLLQGSLPLGDWKVAVRFDVARRSLAQPRLDGAGTGLHPLAADVSENLPGRILSGGPYPVKILLVAGLDPLFEHPKAKDFAKAIDRVPFVVSFSSLPDALLAKAHLVLPDAMFLERWTEDVNTHLAGFSAFSVGQPVVRTKDTPPGIEDTLLEVAKKVGGSMAESFKWKTFADALLEAAASLAEAGRGYVVSDSVDERFRSVLTRQGYWRKEFEETGVFWKALLEKGAWWDSEDEELGVSRQLVHSGGKFEFFPKGLEKILAGFDSKTRSAAELALGIGVLQDRLLPQDPEPTQRKDGEFELIFFRPLALLNPASGDLPWMQEQLGPHVGARWGSWVEIHPADANRLGVRGGSLVELQSGEGRLRAPVRISNGLQIGTLAMPVGLGRPEGGRWAKGRGADPRKLTLAGTDPIRGMGVIRPTAVRVRRIA